MPALQVKTNPVDSISECIETLVQEPHQFLCKKESGESSLAGAAKTATHQLYSLGKEMKEC